MVRAIISGSSKIVNFSEQSELGLIILPSTEKLTVLSQEHRTVARCCLAKKILCPSVDM